MRILLVILIIGCTPRIDLPAINIECPTQACPQCKEVYQKPVHIENKSRIEKLENDLLACRFDLDFQALRFKEMQEAIPACECPSCEQPEGY